MDIIKLLEKPKRKHFVFKNNRIHCTLTGHELPRSSDALLAYAGGKKFDKALSRWTASCSVPQEFRRYLIDASLVEPSRSNGAAGDDGDAPAASQRLFCQLTCRFVSDTPADVARHTSGRRFLAALLAYKSARSSGQPFEPNTSLYRKYSARMTLQGLKRPGEKLRPAVKPVRDSDSEGDSESASVDEEEAEENEPDDDSDQADEEMLEELQQRQPSPPPSKKKKLKRKAKAEPTKPTQQTTAASASSKKKRKQ
ncbi:hypothetical protein BOX15_Mlig030524g2 [Macrostomum lignano]|uniref:Surfeit locus protein 2 n=1 Tax=Macrostomum lignano TaxID=282301 RepID=A0A267GTC8_9PLAT|nr:hypothetical protein BOX15_Mlig030524g2 [Macrostomum lignano]